MARFGSWVIVAALVAGGAQAQSIKIGVNTGINGPVSVAAEWEKWGEELAVAEINAQGGVLGKQIELVYADNRCNPSEAVTATDRLIQAGVVAIAGAHCSSATIAAMPRIKEAKIPMVTAISSSPKITELSGKGGNEWTFRLNPSDSDMMNALASYLAKNKTYSTVAILGEDSDFGRGGAQAFQQVAEKAGLKIVSTDFHPQQLADYTTILTRLQARHPDAIALFQVGNDQANFLRNYQQMGLAIPFTGRVELGGQNVKFIEAGVMEGSTSVWTYSAAIDTPSNKAFAAKVQAKYNSQPYLQTWGGYDQVRVIVQSIAAAGSIDTQKIRDAMQAIKFQTVMGPVVQFDEWNQAGTVMVLQRVKDKKVVIEKLVNTREQ